MLTPTLCVDVTEHFEVGIQLFIGSSVLMLG